MEYYRTEILCLELAIIDLAALSNKEVASYLLISSYKLKSIGVRKENCTCTYVH